MAAQKRGAGTTRSRAVAVKPKKKRPTIVVLQPELITLQQAAAISSLSASFLKKLCRKRKRGESKCPFRLIRIGRAVRLNRTEFLEALNRGIADV